MKVGDSIKSAAQNISSSSSGRPSRSGSGGGSRSSAATGGDGDDFFGTFGVDSGVGSSAAAGSSSANSDDNESWDQDNFGKKVCITYLRIHLLPVHSLAIQACNF
jgi:hypothetical protein